MRAGSKWGIKDAICRTHLMTSRDSKYTSKGEIRIFAKPFHKRRITLTSKMDTLAKNRAERSGVLVDLLNH